MMMYYTMFYTIAVVLFALPESCCWNWSFVIKRKFAF